MPPGHLSDDEAGEAHILRQFKASRRRSHEDTRNGEVAPERLVSSPLRHKLPLMTARF